MNPRTIFLLYESGHVEELERFWREHPLERTNSLVIAFTPDIEEKLAKQGIECSSVRGYRSLDTSRFTLADDWVTALSESPEWEWFRYREVALSQMFSMSIQLYLVQLLYYGTIIGNVLAQHPATCRLVVFPSLQTIPKKGSTLARHILAGVVDCTRLIGVQKGIEVVIPQVSVRMEQTRGNAFFTAFKRAFLDLGVKIYNICITLGHSRHGTPRILASDYWRNIAPIMSHLPQGELVLFDRGEVFNVGFLNLWRFCARLYNFDSYSVRDKREMRAETQKLFEEQWKNTRVSRLLECSYEEISLRPLLVEALDEIVLRAVPEALQDIDGAYAMLEALTPDIVCLRASVSAQTHFYILTQVARALGIPSLEFQHGLEYLGHGSISKRHSAEYVAVYGKAVQNEFVALGFPRRRFPIVGSPRFDEYKKEISVPKQHHLEESGISMLCIGSSVSGGEWFYDNYDLEDYYGALARALEQIPNSSVVIKLRPGLHESSYRPMIDKIFARVSHTIAQYEPLSELFISADIVVSYYSTAVLEALQFNKPTIVFSAQAMEKDCIRLHLARHANAGGLIIADTSHELEVACRSLASDSALRSRLAQGAEKALERFYSFDGRASERIVELIERLSRKQK